MLDRVRDCLMIGAAVLLATGCGGNGACEAAGGIVEECMDGWTKDECQEWDDIGVNGSEWKFHGGKTCEKRGYSHECPTGAKVKSPSSC